MKIHDDKEGAWSIRTIPTLRLEGDHAKGSIINSEGDKDKPAWGKRAKWVDYSGPVNGKTMGVTILNHPKSLRHPTPWHVRTYGLFTANPFGTRSLDKSAADGSIKLRKGESVKLRHRVIFHEGGSSGEAIEKAFAAYAAE